MPEQMKTIVGDTKVVIYGEEGTLIPELADTEVEPGLFEVSLRLSAAEPVEVAGVRIELQRPLPDTAGVWTPAGLRNKALVPAWWPGTTCRATAWAPVACAFSQNGDNRFTVACSDAINPISLAAGVVEETATARFTFTLFAEPLPEMDHYQCTFRLDMRDISYHQALAETSDWWSAMEQYAPGEVPETARRPMYSTWYSFHQNLDVEKVVEQCKRAKALGCEAVIVDDGWQTTDSGRGYAYCGDWKPERISEMADFVGRVHKTGMKFLLWYSVPFVGIHSEAYSRFRDKFLGFRGDSENVGVLDPRYPDVREYLINIYETALRQWDLDGLKLDFVDCFRPWSEDLEFTAESGRDHANIAAAADRLLSDVMERLRAIKPDVMIEFRQAYIGPAMRKYGNMFRAGDCPADWMTNRIRTLDIRQLCGDTAAHADMMMWHPDEPVESAALQLLNVLFSVPQVSVLLDAIPAAHRKMLEHWLGFWNENRDVLLDGMLEPLHPESLYPVVRASTEDKRVLTVYDEAIAPAGTDVPEQLLIVNATRAERVAVELVEDLPPSRILIYDCTGRKVLDEQSDLPMGLYGLEVPPAGLVRVVRHEDG